MIKYISLIYMCCLFLTTQISAQDTLSLAECTQRALEHSQSIKSAETNLQSAELQQKLNKRASLPNFNLDASYLYMGDPQKLSIPGHPLPTVDGQLSNIYSPPFEKNLTYDNTWDASIGISLPLYLGGKLNYARKIAINAKNIAESSVELNKTGIILQVEQQYWTLVSLFEQKKIAENSIKFLNGLVNDLTNLYKNEIITKNEVLKAQVELNNANLFLISISNSIEMLKMTINQGIGNEIETPLLIADSIIEISALEDEIAFNIQNIENRHEIKILNNQEKININSQKMVRSNYLPQLVSFANYTLKSTDNYGEQNDFLTWNAGLALSIPIFHWGESRLKTQQAKLVTETTRNTLDKTKEMITLEVKQAIFKQEEAYTKLKFTKEALQQAEENLSLENNKLKQEVSTATDLLNAQVQMQKAYADFIAAKANVKIQHVLYKKAIGELK